MIAGIKNLASARIGDTITLDERPAEAPLPGFREVKPMVFSSIYPIASDDYQDLKDSLEKYILNDAALTYQKDASVALGQGFRCGFLGLLHLEIVQERLEREFGLSPGDDGPQRALPRPPQERGDRGGGQPPGLPPTPSRSSPLKSPLSGPTSWRRTGTWGRSWPSAWSDGGCSPGPPTRHRTGPSSPWTSPWWRSSTTSNDRLKTVTQGYGSLDYEMLDYRESELVKLDILVNGERVDALSVIVHQESAREWALRVCDRLKKEIPRHQFKIPIQGAIGGKIIARSTISAFRKDVTAKCYGGDITRKRKLLEKQKKGKKRMKMVGSVMIPQSAFVAALKSEDD